MRLNFFALFAACLFSIISANAQIVNEAETQVVLNDKTVSLLMKGFKQVFDPKRKSIEIICLKQI